MVWFSRLAILAVPLFSIVYLVSYKLVMKKKNTFDEEKYKRLKWRTIIASILPFDFFYLFWTLSGIADYRYTNEKLRISTLEIIISCLPIIVHICFLVFLAIYKKVMKKKNIFDEKKYKKLKIIFTIISIIFVILPILVSFVLPPKVLSTY
jgi:membrane protease YdiL (CAAX protease family)